LRPDLRAWVEENPEVAEWLGSVSEGAAELYAVRFKRFYDWLTAEGEFGGFTPAKLLDFQAEARGRNRVKIANRLGAFLRKLAGELRPKTLAHYYSATRSFFQFHGVELPRRGFNLPDDYREPAPQLLTRDDLVRILAAAKLRDKAIYTICFQAALGWKGFNQFNHAWDQIEPQLEKGADHLIVKLKSRKKLRGITNGYFTIIGRDGVRLLKKYLEKRGTPEPGEAIFLSREGRAIAARTYRKNFENLARRVGLISKRGSDRTSRYGYSPHQLRDVFRTEWQKSGADPLVGEFLLGHVVDPNKYLEFKNVPHYVLAEYEKAEEALSVISKPDLGVVPVDEVKRLRREVAELRNLIAPFVRQSLKRLMENGRLDPEVEETVKRLVRYAGRGGDGVREIIDSEIGKFLDREEKLLERERRKRGEGEKAQEIFTP